MNYLALATFFLSMLAIIIEIILRIFNPSIPRGTTTIIIVVLFMGSIQLLCFSILGEYIGRIFEETKQRPKFIVKSILKQT